MEAWLNSVPYTVHNFHFTSDAKMLNPKALVSAIITWVTKIIVESSVTSTNTQNTSSSPVKRTRLLTIASNQEVAN